MNRKYRKTIIAGNWKMNMVPSDIKPFAEALKTLSPKSQRLCEVAVCAPYVDLTAAIKAFRDCKVSIGAENLNEHESGAYTGEVSASMLADLGIKYVIIGHSERRQYYGETDITVNKKVKAAVEAGLTPIICVGESLEQRELGVTKDLVRLQLKSAIAGIDAAQVRKFVIAYEPIWAIGTGKTATAEQANEVCCEIRLTLREMFGARIARSVTIQYGGSMNEGNAAELLAQPDIDGGLIGGASLVPEKFAAIIAAANERLLAQEQQG